MTFLLLGSISGRAAMNRYYRPLSQRELVKMFVLDVLKYDIEQISSIVNLMNNAGCIGWRECWPADFSKEDVIPVLGELVQDGYLDLYDYSEPEKRLVPAGDVGYLPGDFSGNEEKFWYLLTNKGRKLLDIWDPPVSDRVD